MPPGRSHSSQEVGTHPDTSSPQLDTRAEDLAEPWGATTPVQWSHDIFVNVNEAILRNIVLPQYSTIQVHCLSSTLRASLSSLAAWM